MLKKLLEAPAIYQAFQQAGGFFGARCKAICEFLDLSDGTRVIDIGCGPGYILHHLPRGVHYTGFDIDPAYIDHAQRKFGRRGTFVCGVFDNRAAYDLNPADIVMMNGVLHHISDADLVGVLDAVHAVLRPGGLLFSLDGCYRQGQSSFRRWMLDNDRGQFVRDEMGYRILLASHFSSVDLYIRENYSRVPYTFLVGLSAKAPAGTAPSSRLSASST